jgi:very-short-patch-repair endonuclease
MANESIHIVDPELEYYALRMKKISKKKYEFFVISRILNRLDDRDIEFVTQQLVRTDNGRFLLDLYFPQFKLAIEVDEPYHSSDHQVDNDFRRDQAIIDSSKISICRISIQYKTTDEVYSQVESIVERIRELKKKAVEESTFIPFIYGRNSDVHYWLSQGKLDVDSECMFRTHVDVARIFGKHYKAHQTALIRLPSGDSVWFPKLYKNGDWNNQLSRDGRAILMECLDQGRYEAKGDMSGLLYVFAHYSDELGKTFYAFKGVFRQSKVSVNSKHFTRVFSGFEFDGKGSVQAF